MRYWLSLPTENGNERRVATNVGRDSLDLGDVIEVEGRAWRVIGYERTEEARRTLADWIVCEPLDAPTPLDA